MVKKGAGQCAALAQVSAFLLAIWRAKASIKSQAFANVHGKENKQRRGQEIGAQRGLRNNQSRRGKHREISRERNNAVAEPVGSIADRGAGKPDQNHAGIAEPDIGDQATLVHRPPHD